MEDGCGCALGRIEQMIRFETWRSGLSRIVVGVSGGIDSAVAAALCCRAIGGDRVLGLILPAGITPREDIADAAGLCRSLGMEQRTICIDPVIEAYQELPGFTGDRALVGNLMARTRMAILYYHANSENRLVCGTSNRTEYLIGYCTKYGDNAADIQPILHLYKTDIFRYAAELGIPPAIIGKTPTAGLWPGQSDEAEIGLTYPEIDAALRSLEANGWKSQGEIEERVLTMVRKSEHKRIGAQSLMGIC